MNIEEFRTYCLAKKQVTEDFPFGEITLVFRVKKPYRHKSAVTQLKYFKNVIKPKSQTKNFDIIMPV